MKTPPIVLSIAGSDCSGGAGIQADTKTISALGGYAASVITAVTVQNTLGVQAVYPIDPSIVKSQLEAVMSDLQPDAIKIGMIGHPDTTLVIVECLQRYRPRFVVLDPVMAATAGQRLLPLEAMQLLKEKLFPLCTLITPNLNEACALAASGAIATTKEMQYVARFLSSACRTSVLVKGGHLAGDDMCDVLYEIETHRSSLFNSCKIESDNLHGTGCTLSSAIATYLAGGASLYNAVEAAKRYIYSAIEAGKELQIGRGNGPLWHFSHLYS